MSSMLSGTFRKPFFSDRRRSLRLQVGVLRVLRDELLEVTDPERESMLLQHLEDELDRLENMIEEVLVD